MDAVTILVSADPRESAKANEALREGLGFAASQLSVQFILTGEAVRLLTDDPLDFVDGETAEKNLGFYKKWKTKFYVASGNAPEGSDFSVESADAAAVASILSGAERFVRF